MRSEEVIELLLEYIVPEGSGSSEELVDQELVRHTLFPALIVLCNADVVVETVAFERCFDSHEHGLLRAKVSNNIQR